MSFRASFVPYVFVVDQHLQKSRRVIGVRVALLREEPEHFLPDAPIRGHDKRQPGAIYTELL